jgi:AcrR family transcriptional regulator
MAKKTTKTQGKRGSAKGKAGPVRRRLTPEERRVQIVAAAKALFVADGIDNVSMRKIARRVGITQAAIYQHFENKEAILFVIIEHFFGDLLAAFEKGLGESVNPIEHLRRATRIYVEFGLSRPEEYRLVFMTPMSGLVRAGVALPRTEEARTTPSKGSLAFDVLESAVRDVVAHGMSRHKNPELLAEAIWAAGHGIVSLLITHNHFPWSDPAAVIDMQMDLVFRGLLHDNCPMRVEMFGTN